MPRYRLTVAYDGTNFHGWQKQDPPDAEPLRTAQAVLEGAVVNVVREQVNVVGASRTDAGVHALGQVAAFTCTKAFDPTRLAAALNSPPTEATASANAAELRSPAPFYSRLASRLASPRLSAGSAAAPPRTIACKPIKGTS